jgi:hypothetical protein
MLSSASHVIFTRNGTYFLSTQIIVSSVRIFPVVDTDLGDSISLTFALNELLDAVKYYDSKILPQAYDVEEIRLINDGLSWKSGHGSKIANHQTEVRG